MFSQKQKYLALIILSIILTASITTVAIRAVTTAPSTLTISSGVYPGAPDYTIWVESSVYYCKDANGLTTDSGSNATLVFNNAIGNLSSGDSSSGLNAYAYAGLIYVKDGHYYIDGMIKMGRQTRFVGESMMTVIDQTSNNHAFWIWNGTDDSIYSSWEIAHLQIDMNQKLGNGIYSLFPCHTGNNYGASIHDIIINEVAAPFAGINLSRTMMMDFQKIRIDTYGTGVNLENPSLVINTGESYLSDISVGVHDGAVGFSFVGDSRPINAFYCARLEVLDAVAGLAGTGQYAFWVNYGTSMTLIGCIFEYVDYAIYIQGASSNIDIIDTRLWGIKNTGVYLASGVLKCSFKGGAIYMNPGASYVWRDLTSATGSGYLSRQHMIADAYIGSADTITDDMLIWGIRTEVYRVWFYGNGTLYPRQEAIPLPFGAYGSRYGIFISQGSAASPTNTTTYAAFNTEYYITVSGGTGVNCTVTNLLSKVIDASATLTAFRIPRSWNCTFTWTTAPSFSVWAVAA